MAPGKTFKLRVLAPDGATGWRALATSNPVSVTTAAGTDAVNGPCPANIPIAAGSRIALQPVDDSYTPIEMGASGTDGIRYSSAPFDDGSSRDLAPGAGADNGQVVPIQATVDYTHNDAVGQPAATEHRRRSEGGSAADLQPRQVERHDAVRGLVADVLGAGRAGPGKHRRFALLPKTTQVATGPSYVVPDLVPGALIDCSVTAMNAAGSTTASAPTVTVLATRPALKFRLVPGTGTPISPTITPGVGYGGTNFCTPGAWAHYPTVYTFQWYLDPHLGKRKQAGKLVGTGQSFQIGADEELHRACRDGGMAAGLGGEHREFFQPYPTTSPSSPVKSGPDNSFRFSCTPPTYNRPGVKLSYSWELDWPPQSLGGGGEYPGNKQVFSGKKELNLATSTASQQASVDAITLSGYIVVSGSVKCIVTASLSNACSVRVSAPLYFTGAL